MRRLLREGLGYLAASGAALGVDVLLLWSLVQFLSWGYILAASTSFLAGAVVAYVLSVKLAFRQHRLEDRRMEFLSFVGIGVAGLTVNAGVIFAMVRFFGLHYLVAKGVAAGFTFICNFFARRQLLFVSQAAQGS
jgi:putative flippase GtrA